MQNKDNKNPLGEIIKKKLNLSNDKEIEKYNNAFKLVSEFLPITGTISTDAIPVVSRIATSIFEKCTLSYPFLIQTSLVNDILIRVTKNQIPEEIEQVNIELNSLSSQKKEKIVLLKGSSSLKDELDKQCPSYNNLNQQIEKLNARKAQLEDRSNNKFKEELANYIQQLDDSYVQDAYSKFIDEDLQKKLKKYSNTMTVVNYIAISIGIASVITTSIFVFYSCITKDSVVRGSIYNKIMIAIPGSAIFSMAIAPICILLSIAIPYVYAKYQHNSICKELGNIQEELNSNYENYSNLEKDAPKDDLAEATITSQAQSAPLYSTSPQ